MNCPPLFSLLQKTPLTKNEMDFLKGSQCGFNNGKVLVCCPSSVSPQESNPVVVRASSVAGNVIPQPGACGIGVTDRIYGGYKTKIDEFPWLALLEYSLPGNKKRFFCGGVLINSRYVLTASHCVNGKNIPNDFHLSSVRLGEWDTSSDKDCDEEDCAPPPIDVSIEQTIAHEGYDPNLRSQVHDIALLRLSEDVLYSDWIKPICLPSATHLRDATFEGVALDVSGWGKTENVSRSSTKLKARVSGVELGECEKFYTNHAVNLENSQLCAGGVSGTDACQGDSGGPLMGLEKSGRVPYFYLAGIVSFGPSPCGLDGWPGVYTRVGNYIDWIQNNIRP